MPGTLLWKNGRIFTGRRYVEAVLAEDGRVVAAGRSRAVLRVAGTGTPHVDLHGRLAVPGLVDSHLHLAETARGARSLDLRRVWSIRQLGSRVRRWADDHPGEPVLGFGWDETELDGHRYPTGTDLRGWVGDRPAVLYRICTHAALVSAPVLDLLDVRPDSPDPPGGRIGRGPDGSPNGLLFDRALDPLSDWVDRAFSTRAEAIGAVLQRAARFGLTTLGAVSASPDEVRATVTLARRTPLPARVVFYLRAKDRRRFSELRRSSRTRTTDLVGVKLVADGAFGPRTAWLARPYHDRPSESGFPLGTEAELRTVLAEADAEGAALAVHAIGDRTLAAVLDAFEARPPSRRPRIEHASLTPPPLLRRLRTVRPLLVVQPGFVRSDGWIVERLGRRRARWSYAFASLVRDGHAPAGSSDSPVEPLDPWLGLAAAAGPRVATRAPERVPLEVALRFYTVHGGEALGDPSVGNLEPGAKADLVVSRAPTLRSAVATGSDHVARVYRDGVPVAGRIASGGR